jgi:hypothetical protein
LLHPLRTENGHIVSAEVLNMLMRTLKSTSQNARASIKNNLNQPSFYPNDFLYTVIASRPPTAPTVFKMNLIWAAWYRRAKPPFGIRDNVFLCSLGAANRLSRRFEK